MITLEVEKCSGCSRCQVHCAFFHSGRVGRGLARIKVVKLEEIGIDFPVVCQQCEERYCLQCPEKALSVGASGEVVVAPRRCTACGACVRLCPIGAIELYDQLPCVCDLCGGAPRCVDACTMGAICYTPKPTQTVSLASFAAQSGDLTPEEKRVRYALAGSQDLRQRWVSERRG